MTMKRRALVLAMGMAVSGIASADIDNFTTGNGELFFAVYDPVARVSFGLDLPLPTAGNFNLPSGDTINAFQLDADSTFNLNHFLPEGPASVGGFPVAGTVVTPGTEFMWHIDRSSPADTSSSWARFLDQSAAGGGSPDVWKWGVFAGDNTGAQATPDRIRYLSTLQAGSTEAGIEAQQTVSGLAAFNVTETLYISAANNLTIVGDKDFFAVNPSNAYFGQGFTDTWKGNAKFNATNLLGVAADFAYLTGGPSGAQVTIFQNGAKWNFAANDDGGYDLVYTVPVPEPGAWAMFAAGVILVGSIARRRLASNA